VEIVISGSLAYDRIMEFPGRFSDHILPDKIHILNVCFTVEGLQENFGGTAGNIAYSLALLGERPLILSAVGRDFGRYRRWMEEHRLPLIGIREIKTEFTAGAYITTDKDDNQITGFNPGAMNKPSKFKVEELVEGEALAIVSPGNVDDMLAYSRDHKRRKVPYIFDPGQQIPIMPADGLAEMLTGCAVLISNDYELEMIMKATGLAKTDILERAQAVITTLGDEGSVVHIGGEETLVPAVKAVRVKDPTGAGDAYRAGLIKGLVMEKPLPEAARLGAACASFAVEKLGTQAHAFTEDEFWGRFEAAFGG